LAIAFRELLAVIRSEHHDLSFRRSINDQLTPDPASWPDRCGRHSLFGNLPVFGLKRHSKAPPTIVNGNFAARRDLASLISDFHSSARQRHEFKYRRIMAARGDEYEPMPNRVVKAQFLHSFTGAQTLWAMVWESSRHGNKGEG
jgi:hypothetical protein